jgi:hypothetical protein
MTVGVLVGEGAHGVDHRLVADRPGGVEGRPEDSSSFHNLRSTTFIM